MSCTACQTEFEERLLRPWGGGSCRPPTCEDCGSGLSRWRVLCDTPRIMVSKGPIISAAVCSRLIEACRDALDAQLPTDHDALNGQDYRSVPAEACEGFIEELDACGLIAAAARATGVTARAGEDIMVARTARSANCTPTTGMRNLHHDRNQHNDRVATFMVHLSTVNGSGETFFPAAGADKRGPFARSLRQAFERGERWFPRTAEIATESEGVLRAWREGKADGVGVGIAASVGTALCWDSVGARADDGAWHAPCLVTGPEAKYTVSFFKAPPPLWAKAWRHKEDSK